LKNDNLFNTTLTPEQLADFIDGGGHVTKLPAGTAIKSSWDGRFRGNRVVRGGTRLFLGL